MKSKKSESKKGSLSGGLQKVIRRRIVLFMCIGALILVTVYSFFQFFINLNTYKAQQSEFIKTVRQSIQWRLGEADGTIRFLVEQSNRRGSISPEQFSAAFFMEPDFESLLLLDSEDRILMGQPWREEKSDYPGFTPSGYDSPLLFSQVSIPSVHPETGRMTVYFQQRTMSGNYLAGCLDLSFLREIVREAMMDNGFSRLLIVTDSEGNVLARPDGSETGDRVKVMDGFFPISGKNHYVVSTVIPETGWILVDATRLLPLFGELGRSVLSIVLLLLLLILLWGLYAGRLVDRVVVSPLDSFVEMIRRSSAKETPLAVEERLSEYREFLQLQEAFNALAHKIEVRDRDLQKFRLAVREAGFAIYITDREGLIEYVNPAFERITGYTKEEVLGGDPGILNSGEMGRWYFDKLWDTVLHGKIWEGEIINRKKDGSFYYGYQTITPILDQSGRVSNFVALQSDITDRKRMENELRTARDEAEAASRAKSDFVANISHEIRTPMNVILGYNQLLAENTDDPGIRGFIDSIEKAGNVLLNLINDILDISRIESGKLRFEYGEVDLRRLLGDVGQIFNAAIRGKGLEYIEEISVNLPNRVSLDEDRVRQMLLNLVGNAVKFTEEGFVKVRAESSPLPAGSRRTDLLFVVEDSGIGIRQDQQQRVFEAFQQQEGQSSRKFGGTGLGLAITKRLVEAMNGEISVHSRRGTGTVFRVLLKDVEILEKTGSGKLPGQVLSESGVSSEKGESTSMHQLEMYEPEDYIMDGDQLLESLKTDFYPRWEQLRRRMFLDELQGFADSLERLGHTHNAVFLIRYSKKLQQAAQQVDIPELELLIQDYPRILKGAGYRLPESHE